MQARETVKKSVLSELVEAHGVRPPMEITVDARAHDMRPYNFFTASEVCDHNRGVTV